MSCELSPGIFRQTDETGQERVLNSTIPSLQSNLWGSSWC
jgi:hypothetical protein